VHQVGKKKDYHCIRMHGQQNVKKKEEQYFDCLFGLFVSLCQALSKNVCEKGNLTQNTFLNNMAETAIIHL